MKLIRWAAMGLGMLLALRGSASGTSPWEQPASALAEQVAAILGPGQAHLTIRNLSRIPNEDVPAIRKLMEQDLKMHSVTISGDESANSIRVTLSENARERLWVAEVVEGSVTQVAMVRLDSDGAPHAQTAGDLKLHTETMLRLNEPVLAVLEISNGIVVLEPEQILFETRVANGWREQSRTGIGQKPLPRDPKGILIPEGGTAFEAWLAGTQCRGSFDPAQSPGQGTVSCYASDDPWPLTQSEQAAVPVKAFFNSARNYFTGVITPSVGEDPRAFYAAAWIPRAVGGAALVVGGIDGKVLLIENGISKPIAGTRDWGSDFAATHSGCGVGTQIIASSSGEAAADSLRAYELPGLEAVPVSVPLEVGGTVMGIWSTPDGKSVFATVRRADDQYEVDRVTALCN